VSHRADKILGGFSLKRIMIGMTRVTAPVRVTMTTQTPLASGTAAADLVSHDVRAARAAVKELVAHIGSTEASRLIAFNARLAEVLKRPT
jgi:hypothetical protein